MYGKGSELPYRLSVQLSAFPAIRLLRDTLVFLVSTSETVSGFRLDEGFGLIAVT